MRVEIAVAQVLKKGHLGPLTAKAGAGIVKGEQKSARIDSSMEVELENITHYKKERGGKEGASEERLGQAKVLSVCGQR